MFLQLKHGESRPRQDIHNCPGIHLPPSMPNTNIDRALAREAKAIVALAFCNGPIESIHSGKICPTCHGKAGYSRITDAEMKLIMKNAVDYVYKFGLMKKTDPSATKDRSRMAAGSHATGTIRCFLQNSNPCCRECKKKDCSVTCLIQDWGI